MLIVILNLLGEGIEKKNFSSHDQSQYFTNLVKSFNEKVILPEVGLIAIVGKNGSGKSTLLKYLLEINNTTSVHQPQFINTVEASLLENIFHTDEADCITCLDNISKWNDEQYKEFICQNHELHLGTEFGNAMLSTGMKAKMAIVRAFCVKVNFKVVILDEPGSNLSSDAEMSVTDWLKSMAKHKLVICVTHRLELARNASKVIVVDDGLVVEYGNYPGLLKSGGKFKDLCDKNRKYSTKDAIYQ